MSELGMIELIIIVVLFGAFFLLAYMVLDYYTRKKRLEQEVLTMGLHSETIQEEAPTMFKKKNSVIEEKVDTYLKRIKENKRLYFINFIKQHPFFLRIIIVMVPSSIIFYYMVNIILKQSFEITFGLAALLTYIFGRTVYKFFENRRKKAFLVMFPHALDVITRGLRAGLSVEKTFEVISREIKGPVGHEFAFICEQIQVGLPYEAALGDSATRVHIQDYHFFVSALLIQKGLGGSLAAFMENVATVIRRQDELRLKIQALSAEAKTTGMIIGALPFVTLGAITYFQPHHFEVFQNDPMGRKIILIALGLIIVAEVLVNKLTSLE